MSWSVVATGSPEEVVAELQEHAKGYGEESSQSKKEFEDALPHIIGLVSQNYGHPNRKLRVDAYGHGTIGYPAGEPVEIDRVCTVSIKQWDSLV